MFLAVQRLMQLTMKHPRLFVPVILQCLSLHLLDHLFFLCNLFKVFFCYYAVSLAGMACIRCWNEDVDGDELNGNDSC